MSLPHLEQKILVLKTETVIELKKGLFYDFFLFLIGFLFLPKLILSPIPSSTGWANPIFKTIYKV